MNKYHTAKFHTSFSALSMKGCMLALGLPKLTTPINSPLYTMGAATCMTDMLVLGLVGSRLERAPYLPRRVKYTSRHWEKSSPTNLPSESYITTPLASVMYMRNCTAVLSIDQILPLISRSNTVCMRSLNALLLTWPLATSLATKAEITLALSAKMSSITLRVFGFTCS